MHIRIATRRSKLALTQTNMIADRIRALRSDITTELVEFTTRGDQIQDRPLSQVGGKGLFVKELERALIANEADIAIHSAKDVPMFSPDELRLTFVAPAEEPRDAFLSVRYRALAELPKGAKVGTSSLRRAIQLRAANANLQIEPLRGNVDTRLAKLDDGQYGAIILAAAGLHRLGLQHRITALLPIEQSLPAITQGILAIEHRLDRTDLSDLLSRLTTTEVTLRAHAERAVGRALQGSCEVPIAAHAVIAKHGSQHQVQLRAMIATPDGTFCVEDAIEGFAADLAAADSLGAQLGERLLQRGGSQLSQAILVSPKDHI
jgi:hydroxymethylbilane synthase